MSDPVSAARRRVISVFLVQGLAGLARRVGRRHRQGAAVGEGDELADERGIELMHAFTPIPRTIRFLELPGVGERSLVAVVNPRLEWSSDDQETAEEGCLSLPQVSMDVERPLHARVRGADETGEPLLIEASGLEARVLQHEIDHLNGVLFTDRATRVWKPQDEVEPEQEV